MGDDWFHYGAFRQQNLPYIYEQEATRKNDEHWWTSHYDDYDMYMQAGSAGELGRRHGVEQVGFWRKILEHPPTTPGGSSKPWTKSSPRSR